jgi:hypothetical protein
MISGEVRAGFHKRSRLKNDLKRDCDSVKAIVLRVGLSLSDQRVLA